MGIENNIEEIRNYDRTHLFPKKILYEVTDDDIENGVFEVPSEVSDIGKFCFYKCKSLKKIIFSNSNKYIKIYEVHFIKLI